MFPFTVLALVVSASVAAQPSPSPGVAVPQASVQDVALVDAAPIRSDRLEIAVNALVPLESFHRAVSPERMRELRRKALDNLIDAQLALVDASRRRLSVTDAEIERALSRTIAQYPTRRAFDDAREHAHQSVADVRHEIRRALLIQKAYEAAVLSRCQVSEAEAREYFTVHPERFVVPEALHIEAITIGVEPGSPTAAWTDARARAMRVLDELKAGARFSDLARRYSTDKSRDTGGDMGLVHRGSLSDAFEAATQGLSVGDVSDIVQTIYGFHIVRLADTRSPRPQRFAAVAKTLRADLTSRRCSEMNDHWLSELRARASIVVLDPALPARPANEKP